MFNKNMCLLFLLVILTACSSCMQNIESKADTGFDNEEEAEYPFATWETCSQNIGDHPCNFTLKDQNNNDVSLYDFYGDTIVLDFSAMWCGPCNVAATEVQSVADSYEDLSYLTVLVETAQGLEPTADDCKGWADDYGISEPVLAGSRAMIDSSSSTGWNISGWPTFYFITDEMVLNTSLRGYSSSYIDMLIQDTMGE
jgi:thiol-disulfide isomerase/thioredoxin